MIKAQDGTGVLVAVAVGVRVGRVGGESVNTQFPRPELGKLNVKVTVNVPAKEISLELKSPVHVSVLNPGIMTSDAMLTGDVKWSVV